MIFEGTYLHKRVTAPVPMWLWGWGHRRSRYDPCICPDCTLMGQDMVSPSDEWELNSFRVCTTLIEILIASRIGNGTSGVDEGITLHYISSLVKALVRVNRVIMHFVTCAPFRQKRGSKRASDHPSPVITPCLLTLHIPPRQGSLRHDFVLYHPKFELHDLELGHVR